MKHYILILLLLFSFSAWSGIGIKKMGELASAIKESSGLEYYKDKIITHNDSGGEPVLYVINEKGEIERTITVVDAKNHDWEDITAAPDGRFFIGDIGNNNNNRKQCHIYVLNKNFLNERGNTVNAERITFSYEDQKNFPPDQTEMYYDAEAMFWMKDSIYILTKCGTKPFTGRSFVYVLPDKPGNYKARKIGEVPFCSASWVFCAVTSADFDDQSGTLAVLLYGKLVLMCDFPQNHFWKGNIKSYNISGIKQREAIAFIDQNNWYMTDERHKKLGGGFLYLITKK